MKIAINNLSYLEKLKDIKDKEIIYVFDKEPLSELLDTKLHCIHKDYITGVELNLTDYNIPCLKKCTIDDDLTIEPKKNYKFAIIVPNCNNAHGDYNGKTFLENCIESILSQTYKNFELIIVDDMSTDKSVETVENYVDKRIHLIKNTRKRYNGGSRNVGIDYAKTTDADYICFLDSDDWWKHDKVLENINNRLYNHDMLIIGAEMLFKDGVKFKTYNKFDNYKEFFFSEGQNGTLWCTAWARVIRKDKIVYFPEDTIMEDRTWSYEQADNIDYNNITHLKEICYVWNRTNLTNSVSIVRNNVWKASAWKHIGQQLIFLDKLKHKEMQGHLMERINRCITKINNNIYQQY